MILFIRYRPKMPQEVSLWLNCVPFVISIFLFASFHDAMLHYFPLVIILLITISKQTICGQRVKCCHPFSVKSDCILRCPGYLTSTVVMLCNLREMHFETSHYMKNGFLLTYKCHSIPRILVATPQLPARSMSYWVRRFLGI